MYELPVAYKYSIIALLTYSMTYQLDTQLALILKIHNQDYIQRQLYLQIYTEQLFHLKPKENFRT